MTHPFDSSSPRNHPRGPAAVLSLMLVIGLTTPACWVYVHEDDEPAEFHLRGSHADLSCSDCHGEEFPEPSPSRFCFDCHLDVQPEGHLGENCGECHDAGAWDEPTLDHDVYPLRGGHSGVPCIDCHVDGDEDSDDECVDCHLDDIPHGHYTTACDHCHSIWSW